MFESLTQLFEHSNSSLEKAWVTPLCKSSHIHVLANSAGLWCQDFTKCSTIKCSRFVILSPNFGSHCKDMVCQVHNEDILAIGWSIGGCLVVISSCKKKMKNWTTRTYHVYDSNFHYIITNCNSRVLITNAYFGIPRMSIWRHMACMT